MKRLISFLLVLGLPVIMFGIDEQLEKINAIKKSTDYLYGEATMSTQEEATSLAYEVLQKEALNWSQREGKKLMIASVAEINRRAESVMVRRATMYRVFAYVRKSALVQKDTIAQEDSTVQADTMMRDTLPETKLKDIVVTDSAKQMIKQRFFGRRVNDALYRLKEAKNFFELKEIMQPLKEEGKIIDYGKYATAENPELCYLIVYDPAGNICALLGKGKEKRKNLKTGQDDSVTNYRGCGAIWFRLNEEQ